MSTRRAQVVVLGTGAAGLAAALAAVVHGADVTILESADYAGGTTALSGGVAWVAGSPWAAQNGIDDSPERGLEYLNAMDLGDQDPQLVASYVRDAVEVLESIEASSALRWHSMRFPDYHAELPGGHPVGRGVEILPVEVEPDVTARVRADPYETRPSTLNEASAGEPGAAELDRRDRAGVLTRGRGLVAGMLGAALQRGARLHTGARAVSLVTSGADVVGVGVEGQRFDGSVVVATGGFERNQQLVQSFLRGPLVAPAGPPTNRGDGLIMGMSVGARLGNMSEAWWAPAMRVPGETIDGEPFFRILFTDCAQPGGILVDSRGERFVNEATNYNDLGRAFHRFDAARFAFTATRSWLIFDAARRAGRAFVGDTVWTLDANASPTAAPTALCDPPWMIRRDRLEDLADAISVAPEALRVTVDRFNSAAAAGLDRDFGRGDFIYDRFSQGGAPLRPFGDPPYFAIGVLPGSLGTKGGLKTDDAGRVLCAASADTIQGLYAAGNAAANPFGCGYPGPGATIGPALVFGWRAGRAAAGA